MRWYNRLERGDNNEEENNWFVLTFFVVVSTLLTIFAFRITPVTLKRDTFVYEYGTPFLIIRQIMSMLMQMLLMRYN